MPQCLSEENTAAWRPFYAHSSVAADFIEVDTRPLE